MRLDHVYVEVDDPDAVHAELGEVLNASAVWPVTDYGLFRSGGLSLGTFVLELVRFAGEPPVSPRAISGIALAADDLGAELAHLPASVTAGSAEPFGPSEAPWWINTPLVGVASSATVFACDYSPAFRGTLDAHRSTFAGSASLRLETLEPDRHRALWRELGLGERMLEVTAAERERFSLRIGLDAGRIPVAEALAARTGLAIEFGSPTT